MVGIMNNSQELKNLLLKKQELFLEVERITNEIFSAPIDLINSLLESRGKTIEQVILIDDKIKPFTEGNEPLRSVLNCTCDMSNISGEQKELLEEALRIKAIANRVLKNEDSIRLRIENERDSLLKTIENLNHSSSTVAKSYMRSVETGIPLRDTNKKKKI